MDKDKIVAATSELAAQMDVVLMPLLQQWVQAHPDVPVDAMVAVLAGAAGQCCGMVDGNLEAAKGAMARSYELGVEIRKHALCQPSASPTP